ncbi:MAG: polysaccharide deacetylase family protein [Pirellulales bacterium]|nr:polysaccharide deacetylase family protein [Pirellulales bacterium]
MKNSSLCGPAFGRSRGSLLASAWLFTIASSVASAENWAERLGFPPEQRVVLLHANDAGMSPETSAAVAALLESTPLRSASAMAPCPWFANFAAWRRSNPDADVGLQLTLNSELATYRWQPLTFGAGGAHLRDADGFFWRTPIQTMVNATLDDVQSELSAQIERARAVGLTPTHFTTHLGTLVTRPDFVELYLSLARKHWIPAVVVELTPDHIEQFAAQGVPMPDDIIDLLEDYPLPKIDDLKFIPPGESYEAKKAALLAMLDHLQPGITQMAFRPAVQSDALPQISEDWQQRVWDAQLMQDADVVAALKGGNIAVTDWRELMQRFEGSPEPTAAERPTDAAPGQ